MAIEKKSLISTLKTTKKANVASADVNAKPANITSKMRMQSYRAKKSVTNTRRAID